MCNVAPSQLGAATRLVFLIHRNPLIRRPSLSTSRFRSWHGFGSRSHESEPIRDRADHGARLDEATRSRNSPFRGVVVEPDIVSLPAFQTAYQPGADEIARGAGPNQ